jgi:hypothetical protein
VPEGRTSLWNITYLVIGMNEQRKETTGDASVSSCCVMNYLKKYLLNITNISQFLCRRNQEWLLGVVLV